MEVSTVPESDPLPGPPQAKPSCNKCREFFGDESRLPSREAFERMDRLRDLGKPFWIYTRKLPRADRVNTPWDPEDYAWRDQEWASPFEADPDPIHPNGHR
jgi:hypothetical protein